MPCYGSPRIGMLLLARSALPAFTLTVMRRTTSEQCVALKNMGTHSEVEIKVGTPGQKFSVIADTGSNNIIVPSCICKQSGGACSQEDRCFVGTNRSSTFLLEEAEEGGPVETLITFGSGPVKAVIANDMVEVASLRQVTKGVLLMTDNKLNVQHFEGILGLGVPNSNKVMENEAAEAEKQMRAQAGAADGLEGLSGQGNAGSAGGFGGLPPDVIQKIIGAMHGGGGSVAADEPSSLIFPFPRALEHAWSSSEAWDMARLMKGNHTLNRWRRPKRVSAPGFLEQAGSVHFSMCFNEGKDGVLSLARELPEHHKETALGSFGTAHWGVGLNGISIGDSTNLIADICTQKNADQDSACGAIPDSGTTVITAPKEHVNMLYENICDGWERCRKNFTAFTEAANAANKVATEIYGVNPFNIDPSKVTKASILKYLMMDCESWMDPSKSDHGLAELPPLTFHLNGAGGEQQKIVLDGVSYVLEQKVERTLLRNNSDGQSPGSRYIESTEPLNARRHVAAAELIGFPERTKVCMPAFEAMEMRTKKNGPVWIMGTPIFYNYKVGYGLKTSPPSISFTSSKVSPCTPCSSSAASASGEAASSSTFIRRTVKPSSLAEGAGTRQGESSSARRQRRPLQIQGPWRRPSFDVAFEM